MMRENGVCCSLVNVFHTNIWFFIVIGLLVLFVSAGIIIVMSFRGGIGYAGICMRVLVYDLLLLDLLLLRVLSFKMIITARMMR